MSKKFEIQDLKRAGHPNKPGDGGNDPLYWCIQVSNVSLQVSPTEINLRRVLVGHRAAVNVVDFDEKYIVSASGDRTIKVWNTR